MYSMSNLAARFCIIYTIQSSSATECGKLLDKVCEMNVKIVLWCKLWVNYGYLPVDCWLEEDSVIAIL